MRRNNFWFGIFLCIAISTVVSSQGSAQILFDLDEDSIFSDLGINGTIAGVELDGSPATTPVTLTTVDLFAPEFEFVDDGTGMGTGTFEPTTNILFASAGADINIGLQRTSIGVDNPSVLDVDFFGDTGNENRDLNDGEGWVIEFDVDVMVSELDLVSLDDGALVVTVDGMGTFTFDDVDPPVGDRFPDPFGTDVIPAGTDITFSFSSPAPLNSAGLRIQGFTVIVAADCTLADVDMNGLVDFNDIPDFVTVLLMGPFQCEADCDENGVVDFNDIPFFVDILLGS